MDYRKFAEAIIEKNKYDQFWAEDLSVQGNLISKKFINAEQKKISLRIAFILRNIKELKSESPFWNNDYNRQSKKINC